jgi:hypothetical protein
MRSLPTIEISDRLGGRKHDLTPDVHRPVCSLRRFRLDCSWSGDIESSSTNCINLELISSRPRRTVATRPSFPYMTPNAQTFALPADTCHHSPAGFQTSLTLASCFAPTIPLGCPTRRRISSRIMPVSTSRQVEGICDCTGVVLHPENKRRTNRFAVNILMQIFLSSNAQDKRTNAAEASTEFATGVHRCTGFASSVFDLFLSQPFMIRCSASLIAM